MEQRFPHLSPLKMLEATLLADLGRTKESEAAVAEALAIFPGYADYAQLKARTWLKTPYFANPIGRRMTLAFAQQAVLASRGQDASALECLAAAKAASRSERPIPGTSRCFRIPHPWASDLPL